ERFPLSGSGNGARSQRQPPARRADEHPGPGDPLAAAVLAGGLAPLGRDAPHLLIRRGWHSPARKNETTEVSRTFPLASQGTPPYYHPCPAGCIFLVIGRHQEDSGGTFFSFTDRSPPAGRLGLFGLFRCAAIPA